MEENRKNDPAYMKVYHQIKAEIQKGTYPIGSFIPKESELEALYKVSRTTIRKAIKLLVDEETLEVRQGRGTKVLNYKARQNYTRVSSVTEALRKRGYDVTIGNMEIDIIESEGQIAECLEIPYGEKVARIQRLVLADGRPVTIMENYIAYDKVPEIENFNNKFVALYQFIEEQYGLKIEETKDRIFAKQADFLESQVLQTEPKEALLIVERVTYYKDHPVTMDHVRIIGSEYEVEIRGRGRLK
nr:GntR family transcriptional regulator [uncultured Mediterraneibacter sp.]